jgi:hypothetical protein
MPLTCRAASEDAVHIIAIRRNRETFSLHWQDVDSGGCGTYPAMAMPCRCPLDEQGELFIFADCTMTGWRLSHQCDSDVGPARRADCPTQRRAADSARERAALAARAEPITASLSVIPALGQPGRRWCHGRSRWPAPPAAGQKHRDGACNSDARPVQWARRRGGTGTVTSAARLTRNSTVP